jgi:tripartite-type tricarboxylate transporter receptor subunit TctC
MQTSRPRLTFALACAAAVFLPPAALAQPYPSKPIRMLVGFPPGGGADIVARQLAPKLGEQLGQQVVIDNRGGASGNIALEVLAKAVPDGYTLMMTTPTVTVNPALYPKVAYDSLRDFAPVRLVASTAYILVVHPSVPAKTVQELVALAKARPRQLNYSSGGNGAAAHLAGELFRSMTGIEIVHVPYKGVAPALISLLGSEVQLTFSSQPSTIPHLKEGRLRALGITSPKRSGFTPDIPTIAESGVPGYDTTAWYGVLATARTPAPVIARLNAEAVRSLQTPETAERIRNVGGEPLPGTPADFRSFLREEIRRWAPVIVQSGAKSEVN